MIEIKKEIPNYATTNKKANKNISAYEHYPSPQNHHRKENQCNIPIVTKMHPEIKKNSESETKNLSHKRTKIKEKVKSKFIKLMKETEDRQNHLKKEK